MRAIYVTVSCMYSIYVGLNKFQISGDLGAVLRFKKQKQKHKIWRGGKCGETATRLSRQFPPYCSLIGRGVRRYSCFDRSTESIRSRAVCSL